MTIRFDTSKVGGGGLLLFRHQLKVFFPPAHALDHPVGVIP